MFVTLISIILVSLFPISVFASENDTPDYGKYESFSNLYTEYQKAVESGDTEAQKEMLEIAQRTLSEEIEAADDNATVMRADPDYEYYYKLFPTYFSSGYWEQRADGVCLTLHPISANRWSSSDKDLAWDSTYARFGYYNGSGYWPSSATNILREQFYCHARLIYSSIETEWNLEPWRQTMNPITCN